MVILITGVLGAGKTTVGSLLAGKLGWEFVDADSFHSPANLAKMHRGIPLTDTDREPWLGSIRDAILRWLSLGRNVVIACSALKRAYREKLVVSPTVKLVYLKGSFDLIRSRVRDREGHFAGHELLASQFAELEEPAEAIAVDVNQSPQEIMLSILRQLQPELGPDIGS
jgi:gluconokinase